jgi:carboxymethylenebutenolidase
VKLTNRVLVASIVISSGSITLAAAPYGDYGHAGHHEDDVSRTLALSPAVAVADPYLPAVADAKHLLNTMSRHREWVEVETASGTVFAFVVYPDRSDPGPVVLVTERSLGATEWARAAADQVAAAGFIAIVPDVLTGLGPEGGATDSFASGEDIARAMNSLGAKAAAERSEAVRRFGLAMPIANGESAVLELDNGDGASKAVVRRASGSEVESSFALTPQSWRAALSFVTRETHDTPVFVADGGHAHHAVMAQVTAPSVSYSRKHPDMPAGFYTAEAALADSTLRKEWITLDVGGAKVSTWIVYPEGEAKAGTVVVMQHGVGMDAWVQGVADQLARSGFIAIAPDVWSGTAPDGGGLRSFKYLDDALLAARKVSQDEIMRRYAAARDYALALPRSNGKSASLGFCMGGGHSFRFAGDVPELNAAVVFYGVAPDEATMAKIKAPVLGLYGENDARVVATVAPAVAAMSRLGKRYEPHIYPKATHSFVLFQEVAGNQEAMRDGWPRAVAFLKQNLE